MKQILPIILLFAFILPMSNSFGQLTVDSTLTPAQLVQRLVGPGITVSNISFTGASGAAGSFTEPTAGMGLLGGIMLASGSISNAIGPNNLSDAQTDYNLPGDPLLDTLSGGITYDATVLEFDFASQTDSIEFNYVFGSEEYNEYVFQGFNDVFGFFISGPGINGVQNIAIVPGTTQPVLIDNVNNGYALVGTLPTGPCTNCQYYVENTGGTLLQYDGYTTVLTARSAVMPCGVYHIKLVIADATDNIYDSGVFLQENSFKATGTFSVRVNGNDAPDRIYICPNECVTLTAPVMPNYLWNTMQTTQSISACNTGFYQVSTNTGTCQAISDAVQVVVTAGPPIPSITVSDDTLYSSVINPDFSYQWYWNNVPITGSNGFTHLATDTGCYKLEITDSIGCVTVSDSVCLLFVAIASVQANQAIELIPNPADDHVLINLPGGIDKFNITILDVTGREVYSQKDDGNIRSVEINTADYARGLYFVSIRSEQRTINARLMIR